MRGLGIVMRKMMSGEMETRQETRDARKEETGERNAREVYTRTAARAAPHSAEDVEDLGRSPMRIPRRHPYVSLWHPMRWTCEHPILRRRRRRARRRRRDRAAPRIGAVTTRIQRNACTGRRGKHEHIRVDEYVRVEMGAVHFRGRVVEVLSLWRERQLVRERFGSLERVG